jgi:hypothetical protein
MDNYQITPVGTGFQVVEDRPDGRHSFVDGFLTENDARGWLDSFLVLIGLLDCMAGKPTHAMTRQTTIYSPVEAGRPGLAREQEAPVIS